MRNKYEPFWKEMTLIDRKKNETVIPASEISKTAWFDRLKIVKRRISLRGENEIENLDGINCRNDDYDSDCDK